MSENCTHDCSSCGENCSSRKAESLIKKPHKLSKIKKVIAVVSGKGGVGKSMTSAMLAVSSQRRGFNTAVMDADITGPSIPKMFGIHSRAMGSENGILPVDSATGVQVMSMNLLLEREEEPVVWRGALISGTVLQFWTDVIWEDIDYMFVDMPPGTGDVPLTVFQSIPLDGVIIVSSPQDLVAMIVGKAVNMANMMNIPIIGAVENMSYALCPHCNEKLYIYGESHIESICREYGIELLGRIPITPELTKRCDSGDIEAVRENWLDGAVSAVEKL